jgi:hypothetical protein
MAEDTKDVRNQPPASESPYSESQVERGNPSNATKQPGRQSREHQGGQGSPTKGVKKGDEQKQENQKTGKH